MIELEPIKQIKSPNSENVIIFALRCANYMVINDKLNGLIVLDLEWREVNRIYIGEQLLLIEAIYTDMVRNRIVFKLDSSLCLVDIDARFVKLIPISVPYFDVSVTDKYGLAVAENQLQIFNLNGDIKSKILSYKRPWYGGRADIVEKDDGLHLYVISHNDLEELTSLSDYVIPFDKIPNHVVLL